MGVFIDPTSLPASVDGFIQLLFLLLVYGYILGQASNLISDGSELLLLVPALAGVVGSVVLPVLGAVPDGAIVLFSGLGDDAQNQLTVGVGALAGSTIMLLTIPWAMSILGGRVDLGEDGQPVYKKPHGHRGAWQKLAEPRKFHWNTGVHVTKPVQMGAAIMLFTSITYLIIQIPAFVYYRDSDAALAKAEKPWAIVGLLVALVSFVGYLWYQWRISGHDQVKEDRISEIAVTMISNHCLTLLGVMGPEFTKALKEHGLHTDSGGYGTAGGGIEMSPTVRGRLSHMIRPFFNKYDADRSGHIDVPELALLFKDLGESLSSEELRAVFEKFDKDKSGELEFEEFTNLVVEYSVRAIREGQPLRRSSTAVAAGEGVDDDEEEEEEMPEDLKDLPWETQQLRLLLRSMYMMCMGTLLVLVFSDPMVEVLSEMGERTGIPAFYISFVLSPLVSNASELIASYNYSLKKTTKTITISLATLTGAACLNNTFVLSVFLLLIYVRGLAWEFSAETISILFVELVIGVLAFRSVHTVPYAYVILSLYPLSLALVYVLENVFGFD